MGGSPISSRDVKRYYDDNSHIRSSTNASQVFKEQYMRNEFNPAKIKLPREACDSSFTPNSKGIILAEDFTGSMDSFLHSLIKDDFPRLIKQIYDIGSFDPHIMFMGVGDVAAGDKAPLQVTQFEADLRMLEQLQKLYVEHGGGGNNYESYILPWYFAGKHIKMDCWDKRKEKGFLFTFGDEEPTPKLTAHQIKEVFGDNDELETSFITAEDCLEMASEKFNCYHIILPGYYRSHYEEDTINPWRELMGGHVCDLSDHTYLPELVSTILKMYEGISKTDAIAQIQGSEAKKVVSDALKWHEENIEISDNSSAEANMEVF
ncbi:MAG: hypothetical protein E7311_03410 [Clostridiales bacterium]|nr:hypothetical protein [Clostridiales bacterium]